MNAETTYTPRVFASREQVMAALVRAAEKARILAEQTGTKLVVVNPPPAPAQQAQSATK